MERRGERVRVLLRLVGRFEYRKPFLSFFSFFLNLLYVGFNTVAALRSQSAWHGALAGYYALLTAMRGVILFRSRRLVLPLSKRYRICGRLLLFLPVFLMIAVAEMAVGEYRFADVRGIVSIPALYALFRIITAIRNFLRMNREAVSELRALCNISLAEAATSVFSLQGAVLALFTSVESPVANAFTGGAVSVLIFLLGARMLHATNGDVRR